MGSLGRFVSLFDKLKMEKVLPVSRREATQCDETKFLGLRRHTVIRFIFITWIIITQDIFLSQNGRNSMVNGISGSLLFAFRNRAGFVHFRRSLGSSVEKDHAEK